MHLSSQERDSLQRIRVEKDLDPFDSYGPIDGELIPELAQHLSGMGQNNPEDVKEIASTIQRLGKEMTQALGKEAAWISVRVSLPNDVFDIPRWHPDGKYFTSSEKTYKLVATLKGAQTLFGRIIDPETYRTLVTQEQENSRANENNREAFEKEDLRIRGEIMKVVVPMAAPSREQATAYLVGDDDAVIHSEPSIKEPRIFISVLPGSKEQIEEWRKSSS